MAQYPKTSVVANPHYVPKVPATRNCNRTRQVAEIAMQSAMSYGYDKSKDHKAISTTLAKDNSNQDTWHDDVQSYCDRLSTIKFLYKRYNQSYAIKIEDIKQAPVRRIKSETVTPKIEAVADCGVYATP